MKRMLGRVTGFFLVIVLLVCSVDVNAWAGEIGQDAYNEENVQEEQNISNWQDSQPQEESDEQEMSQVQKHTDLDEQEMSQAQEHTDLDEQETQEEERLGDEAYAWGETASEELSTDETASEEVLLQDGETNYTFSYEVINERAKTIRITGIVSGEAKGNLEIPSRIEGYTVKEIGDQAFANCNGFTGNLVIPNSVTSIGQMAFYQCSGLEGDLNIPDGLTNIGMGAFANCEGLNGNLKLGKGLKSIGEYAFYECRKLSGTVYIPSNVKEIGISSFEGCEGLDKIVNQSKINNIILPASNDYTWKNLKTGKEDVNTISAGETTEKVLYGKYPVNEDLQIKYLKTDASHVAIIGYFGTPSGSLVIPDKVENCEVTEIRDNAFQQCNGFEGNLVIPEGVLKIGDNAFEGCSGFNGNLSIPDSVTMLGEKAFYNCSGFNGTISISSGLTKIEASTFYGCKNLKGKLTVPDTISVIGECAFGECSGLDGILTLGKEVTEIGDSAFYNCSGLKGSLIIPEKVQKIGQGAFQQCEGFDEQLLMGSNVSTIGSYAFKKCSGLKGDLTIPESVNAIEEQAFGECSGIDGTITIGKNVRKVGYSVFYRCTGAEKIVNNSYIDKIELPELEGNCWYLGNTAVKVISEGETVRQGQCKKYELGTEWGAKYYINDEKEAVISGHYGTPSGNLIIPSRIEGYPVTVIEKSAFESCYSLSGDLSIPDTVKVIEERAFCNCKNMTGGLTIGNSVERIDQEAFSYCIGLTGNLALPNTLETIGKQAFYSCYGLTGNLIIPDSVITIESNAFEYCSGFKGNLKLGQNLKTIEYGAFYSCTGLTGNIIFPDSLTSIGGCAFMGCSLLSGKVVIPPGVTYLDNGMFYGCHGITEIVIHENVSRIDFCPFGDCNGLKKVTNRGTATITDMGRTFDELGSGYSWVNVNTGEWGITKLPGGQTAVRSDIYGTDFQWEENTDTTARITGCKEVNDGDLLIPVKMGSYDVTDVSEDALNNQESVTRIVNESVALVTLPTVTGHYWMDASSGKKYIKTISAGQTAVRNDYISSSIHYEGIPGEGLVYTGNKIVPAISVYDGKALLTEKKDYTISFKNNINVYTLSENDEDFNATKAPSVTITFKGNYSGKATFYFVINPKNITDSDVAVADVSILIEGAKAVKPVPAVTFGKKKLSNAKDLDVKYFSDEECTTESEPKTAGKYYIKYFGKGNYTGEIVKEFTIYKSGSKPVSKLSVSVPKSLPYNGGAELQPEVNVKDGKKDLIEGEHYTVECFDNREIGTASVVITGRGETYVGTKTVTFKITGEAINKLKVTGLEQKFTYDGKEKKQDNATVVLGDTTKQLKWIEKSEYDKIENDEEKFEYDAVVTYLNNIDSGTATIIFTGVNRYTGTVKKTYKISALDICNNSDISVKLEKMGFIYSKAGNAPEPVIKYKGRVLVKGKDYTLSYSNNKGVSNDSKKLPTVKVTGKGNFKGVLNKYFTILPAEFGGGDNGDLDVVVPISVFKPTAGNYKVNPTLYHDGVKLVAGKDYNKKYKYVYSYGADVWVGSVKGEKNVHRNSGEEVGAKDIVPAGTYITLIIEPVGNNYYGKMQYNYTIAQEDIGKLTVTVKSKEYTGGAVTLTDDDISFKGKEAVTFEIMNCSYSNNVNKGKASVQIVGTDNYGGVKTVTFDIKEKKSRWCFWK